MEIAIDNPPIRDISMIKYGYVLVANLARYAGA
jgi:hypothetical protein